MAEWIKVPGTLMQVAVGSVANTWACRAPILQVIDEPQRRIPETGSRSTDTGSRKTATSSRLTAMSSRITSMAVIQLGMEVI